MEIIHELSHNIIAHSGRIPCVPMGVVGVYVSPTDFCVVIGLIYAQGLTPPAPSLWG
jgi:hypothetical protein